ncbi:MAG: hypothetical protein WC280_03620 [Patescibacteria group bacterium]
MKASIDEMPKDIQDFLLAGWQLGLVSNTSIVLKNGNSRKLWDVSLETFVCSWSR